MAWIGWHRIPALTVVGFLIAVAGNLLGLTYWQTMLVFALPFVIVYSFVTLVNDHRAGGRPLPWDE